MDDALEYNDIYKEDRGAMNIGRMKIVNQSIIFKSHKTGKVEHFPKGDVSEIDWQRLPSNYSLRVVLNNGSLFRFMGFQENDYEKLKKSIDQHLDLDLSPKELCLKGWNWGTANFKGTVLSFDIDEKSAFEIPLNYVSHCTSTKNEVTLEFHQNDAAAVSLMELRFHLPSQADTMDDRVQAFTDAVLSKANIIQATGDAIVTFTELQCLTPRGRYDIKIFPTFIQLHGKTFDYKIPLTTVLRLFRLPHKDGRQIFFVFSLDPPIKQGQTRYHFLILLFNKDDETSVELSMTDRELKEKYEGKLEKDMSGPTYDVLGQIMKVLVQRKITNPGITGVGANNPAIACSHRAGAGLLYPLERGFIYIHKPPVHIRFDEIASINFARSGGSTRSFDFEVETKSGVVHTFSSIEKEEYSKLYDFVTNKKLRVKNTATEQTKQTVEDDLIDSDEEGEPDAYLARVKHEGKVREEEGDSDESDESFNPEADGSGSEGDVAEEFDSNASESSSSEGDSDASSGAERRKKEKKAEKEKKKEKEKAKKASKSKSKEKRTEKKSKKDKDSDRPKKPMTAYFLWLNENRERLKKEHPGLSLTELTKKAAEIWRTNVGDKSKWEKQSQEAKKKYEVDMAAYKASGGGSGAGESSKSKSKPSSKSKSSKPDSAKKKNVSPVKSGSFKSKEYISEDDSSSDEDRKPKISKKGGSPSASGSDEEMKSLSSGSASDSD
ncbi:FACT complex subunit Ssrp1 [Tetranychus urticae]|uniref:FACT complex subunit SSRP1 n=1 Tax=Tetranychus urticae TaxID=32264 RepID=T1JSI6_TETUR|nr:FACT complex subunit Ssrp1 [Tetranychus urticae]